ncbi:MAG: hypothetical protein AAGA66_06705 [Bacteroidota bacterium]
MKRTLKLVLFIAVCSLAACQEELPTPENIPSQEYEPGESLEPEQGDIN